MRHRDSINEQAAKKYPGVPAQDTCFVVEYVKTSVSPDVQIQVVPIEGTEWTQYLHQDPTMLANHYELRRQGKHSNLIISQCNLIYPIMEVQHTRDSLETDRYNFPVAKAEHLRTSAFDPDGTRLSSQPDMHDEVLRQVDLARSKENKWICHVGTEKRQLDVFEAVEVIHKAVMRVG